jgi:hypothetical protein
VEIIPSAAEATKSLFDFSSKGKKKWKKLRWTTFLNENSFHNYESMIEIKPEDDCHLKVELDLFLTLQSCNADIVSIHQILTPEVNKRFEAKSKVVWII